MIVATNLLPAPGRSTGTNFGMYVFYYIVATVRGIGESLRPEDRRRLMSGGGWSCGRSGILDGWKERSAVSMNDDAAVGGIVSGTI